MYRPVWAGLGTVALLYGLSFLSLEIIDFWKGEIRNRPFAEVVTGVSLFLLAFAVFAGYKAFPRK